MLINRTQTAVGSGAQYLIGAQVGGVSKFSVSNTGQISAYTINAPNGINRLAEFFINGNYFYNNFLRFTMGTYGTSPTYFQNMVDWSSGNAFEFTGYDSSREMTALSGSQAYLAIKPYWNQTDTASGTDLLINRTQTAVGSGAQYLIDAQVGGVSKFSVTNTGSVTAVGLGAMDADDQYVCIDPTTGVLTTGATCTASSLRYKKNIAAMTGGLNTVMQLRPVTFDWKYNNQPGLGFIAEEVEQINPTLITYDDEGKVSGLHYDWMSAILAKAIQEQQTSIADLTTNESVQTQNLASLQLKTDENITTIQQLQDSVDEELAKADLRFKDNDLRIADLENQASVFNEILEQVSAGVKTLADRQDATDDLMAILQSQMDELKKLTNQELNVAQIEANKTDIDYLRLVLGLDHTENGSLQILGNLEADGVVAGIFKVKVSDKDKATIGEAEIKAGDASVDVETKAVGKDSEIFITPKNVMTDQQLVVIQKKEGVSFSVAVKNPAESDIEFSWWIVDKK